MLTMDAAKQHIFIQRVLFLYELNKRSAGKAQSLRMAKQDWSMECDVSCVCGYALAQMQRFRDTDNKVVFTNDCIKTMMNRFIEGYLSSN